MPGLGVRCVNNEPWVTAAETAECAIAFNAAGLTGAATELLSWTRPHRDGDGSYWTGIVYPKGEQFPADEQHIALHDGHLITANDRDRLVVTGALLAQFGYARDAGAWRDHVQALAAGGATEVAYQPAGPDIPGELERFAAAVHDAL
jgi:GH15 family glucan-1,4-alpha-glucosidase